MNIERNYWDMENKGEFRKKQERPEFPKRAVVTAGMPYGNKELHFGHVGGVFIQADVYARFLRDRIGAENVIFVSGTDCYGSPIVESYRKQQEEGTIEEYVRRNHIKQKETLDAYEISLNLYGASALGKAGENQNEMSEWFFETLYEKGQIVKMASEQFFDVKADTLLNGRQVVGKCPIQGCSSESAYADECAMGHQYMPSELIHPVSTLSGEVPVLKKVYNWYFKLDEWRERLSAYSKELRQNKTCRKYALTIIDEFLKEPYIYVTRSFLEQYYEIQDRLPKHQLLDEGKNSVVMVFEEFQSREEARLMLSEHGIHYRTGKTLVPFRISGNIFWGVPLPPKEDLHDLTFWVWPESLWAPIAFTKTYLETMGQSSSAWEEWWKSTECKVYQFIGEDNIYFYSIAEMALFMAMREEPDIHPQDGSLQLPEIIANHHVLYQDKKVSSSSEVKPPLAGELLQYYTAEQLRMHFLSLGLSNKSASFKPKSIGGHSFYEGADLVLKEGNLLTNVYNRLLRSCFYTAQKYTGGKIPLEGIEEEIIEKSKKTILDYERKMYEHEFHRLSDILDDYVRNANKYWVNHIRIADTTEDNALRLKILANSFYMARVTATLLHPIAPDGCERVREYLNFNEKLWDWKYIFEGCGCFMDDKDSHAVRFLQPKEDFFEKHPSQLQG